METSGILVRRTWLARSCTSALSSGVDRVINLIYPGVDGGINPTEKAEKCMSDVTEFYEYLITRKMGCVVVFSSYLYTLWLVQANHWGVLLKPLLYLKMHGQCIILVAMFAQLLDTALGVLYVLQRHEVAPLRCIHKDSSVSSLCHITAEVCNMNRVVYEC